MLQKNINQCKKQFFICLFAEKNEQQTYDQRKIAVYIQHIQKGQRRKPAFTDNNHEKAWLLRTAVNKCKNHLKSGWVSKTVPLEDNLSDSALQTEDSGLDDTKRAVLEAVNSLPEKYRTVIHLFYYSGLSIQEIAAAKHISSATVGTQLARGRELLKKKLGDDF